MVFITIFVWYATLESESYQHISMLLNNNACGSIRCTFVNAENLPRNKVSLCKYLEFSAQAAKTLVCFG